jgi:hypothetical protein
LAIPPPVWCGVGALPAVHCARMVHVITWCSRRGSPDPASFEPVYAARSCRTVNTVEGSPYSAWPHAGNPVNSAVRLTARSTALASGCCICWASSGQQRNLKNLKKKIHFFFLHLRFLPPFLLLLHPPITNSPPFLHRSL